MHSKPFLIFAALLLIASAVSAETIVPGGDVSGTWNAPGSPYLIQGHINLSAGVTLNIDPGVKVIFQGHYKFTIHGNLQAVGTASDNIIFTAADPDTGWHGLRFYDLNTQPDSSRLVYCNLTNGITASDPTYPDDKHGGAVFCSNSSRLVIRDCLFADNQTADVIGADAPPETSSPGESVTSGNGGAIYLLGSSPEILFSTFNNNKTGNATGGNGGFPHWQYTYGDPGGLGGSTITGDGGAIYNDGGEPSICENQFSGNSTGNGTGGNGGEGGEGYDPYIGDVWAGDGGSGGLSKVGSGGALYSVSTLAEFSNNNMINNFTGTGRGGNGGLGGLATTYNAPGEGGDGGDGGDAVGGGGGAVFSESIFPSNSNNIFINNCTGEARGGSGGTGGTHVTWSYGSGGNGGDGGDATGGEGCAIVQSYAFPAASVTLTQNHCGINTGGSGGAGGYGSSYSGDPGWPGIGESGEHLIYSNTGTLYEITSAVIWNNQGIPANFSAQFNYSCIEGGWPGVGNISTDPLFLFAEENDFRLQWGSPCIDTGNPDPQYNDPDGTIADMGAYYYDQSMPVNVFLTPHDAPLIIPTSGGSFDFTIWLNNIGTSPQLTEIWCDVRDLSGTVLATVIGPVQLDVAASAQLNRVRTQVIPAGLSMGTYTFNAFAVADSDTSSDSFSFFKDNANASDNLCGWVNTGEVFGVVEDFSHLTPTQFALMDAYPNPFNPSTLISYQLPVDSHVNLTVYDVAGRQVAELVDGYRDAGVHEVTFNESGLTSGMYFYQLRAGDFNGVGKMILVK